MPIDVEYRAAFLTARELRDLEDDPVTPARDYWRSTATVVSGP